MLIRLWAGSGRLWSLDEDALQHPWGHLLWSVFSQGGQFRPHFAVVHCWFLVGDLYLAPGVVFVKLYSQNMCHGAMFHLGSMLKLS